MIRTVTIPRNGRLGAQYEITPGCIMYYNPDTGEPSVDPTGSSSCGPGTLPADPGAAAALSDFAASTSTASSSFALNQTQPSASALLAQALASNSPSTIPGPGIGLFNLPSPLAAFFAKYGILLGIALVGLVIVSSPARGHR